MLIAFVTTAAYGGSLRAFLMAPNLEDPVDTVKDVLDIGLPRQTVLYGEELEDILEKHEDEDLRKFWRGMEPVDFELFPYERVSCTCLPID